MSENITLREYEVLKSYHPETYGMNVDPKLAKTLEEKGLITWLPYNQWSGTIYGITPKGEEAVRKINGN